MAIALQTERQTQNIHSKTSNFNVSFQEKVDLFLKGHVNQGPSRPGGLAKRGWKKQTLDQQELCDLTV